jgi:hypothetical protein
MARCRISLRHPQQDVAHRRRVALLAVLRSRYAGIVQCGSDRPQREPSSSQPLYPVHNRRRHSATRPRRAASRISAELGLFPRGAKVRVLRYTSGAWSLALPTIRSGVQLSPRQARRRG